MLQNVFGFLVILGPLVVVHELGHFLFARLFGVKAEIFSVGFGPRLWYRQLGETELRICAIPLGGFVKLLGEDPEQELPPELQHRALQRQAPWKRFFIFFGGPLFNFIFAVFVFMAILLIGEPQLSSVVGRVLPGSRAEQAGFQSGDRILDVDGKPVSRYDEVMAVITQSPGKKITFDVQHPDSPKPAVIQATPTGQDGFSVYGEQTSVGEIEGLFPASRDTQVGVSDPQSAAAKAGIKSGDRIIQLNGTPVQTWEQIERLYKTIPADAKISLNLEGEKGAHKEISFSRPAEAPFGKSVGLYSSELFVDQTIKGSPAEKSGIKPGDRLIGIGDKEVSSFFELKDLVQSSGEKTGAVQVKWEHEGQIKTASIQPTVKAERDPALKTRNQYTIGIMPMLTWAEPQTITERVLNPFTLVFKATDRMMTFSARNLISLGKMVTGKVSMGTLGGPILIGKLAGESLSKGLISFLTMMAILSVGLGILNILPVPVLDGGHLMLLLIEAARGKPLTLKQMERAQQVGFFLILALMLVVMRNDVVRLLF